MLEKEYDSMPGFMRQFHEELISREQPDSSLKKREYILEWLNWFDAASMRYMPSAADYFMTFSKKVVMDGFKWTVENFVELDLGGSVAWLGAAQKVMRIMRDGKWNSDAENKLKLKIINEYGRRW